MTGAEILRAAADLITPQTWTQGVSARDRSGLVCPSRSSRAAYWCAEGALLRAADNIDAGYEEAAHALHASCGGSFVKFNDTKGRKAEEVSAVILRAARKLERALLRATEQSQ